MASMELWCSRRVLSGGKVVTFSGSWCDALLATAKEMDESSVHPMSVQLIVRSLSVDIRPSQSTGGGLLAGAGRRCPRLRSRLNRSLSSPSCVEIHDGRVESIVESGIWHVGSVRGVETGC